MKRNRPLRRIMIGAAATAAGVVLLLALKQPGGSSVAGVAAPPPGGVVVSAPPAGDTGAAPDTGEVPPPDAPAGEAPPAGDPVDEAPADEAPPANEPPAAEAPPAPRTVLGDAVDTQYGPVQVQLTLSGGRIVKAEARQAPGSDAQSKSVTANAVPKLNQAAVSAQGAGIDAVSGASYTSKGYQDSLQSALDKAGV
ncbi:FMN-binding protein [Streptomyces sp. NBC_01498]|uniref:FMN-binding protein n=1 Tax=Streptomyces sp. NBC_01498 TaxID=2975870 RepID=UPI002E7B6F5A|nr:FMN-binding protein [Streptomyces sp. NBC_01498]WTL28358.1 FMN-binding protein [Streptomyces sp. NBC_01498]